ncbi:MAG: bifunctional folylpolyglutamate synthase/dihydrofolate synthase [Nitrospina sp.]|jgi:dihydrofolate synthase/folylpolyglutamate synthase|nr:bifunctional folylpolyglutamate synthase/dihydrofolate synthase [Nitrospina sp.]
MNDSRYREALDYLYSLTHSGIKLGLQNTSQLLEYFGNPHLGVRTIHISGTNGKGSTAAIIESILRTAGLKTGLYTSPHLLDFRERIQVNRSLIDKQSAIELILKIKAAVEKLDIPVTFFEFGTVLAFLYFEEQHTDVNILEVGLGGRLDATNLCQAEISLITSISHDHTEYLGDDLKQIAFEKASIIKESGTVFAHIPDKEIFNVVNSLAQSRNASIDRLNHEFQVAQIEQNEGSQTFDFISKEAQLKGLRLPLMGQFQAQNAGLALAACLKFLGTWDERKIRKGLENVQWEGRLEIVANHPTVVLDCAHNVASVRNMTAELCKNITFTRCLVVLGLMKDKEVEKIIEILSQFGDLFFAVQVNPQRGETAEKLKGKLEKHNKPVQVSESVSSALQAAKNIAKPDDLVCITGSIFTVAEAKKYFQNEKNLSNPWNSTQPGK